MSPRRARKRRARGRKELWGEQPDIRAFAAQNQLVVRHSVTFNSFQLRQKRELRACITAARGALRAERSKHNPGVSASTYRRVVQRRAKEAPLVGIQRTLLAPLAQGDSSRLHQRWMGRLTANRQGHLFISLRDCRCSEQPLGGKQKKNRDVSSKRKATASSQQRVKCKHCSGCLVPAKVLLKAPASQAGREKCPAPYIQYTHAFSIAHDVARSGR